MAGRRAVPIRKISRTGHDGQGVWHRLGQGLGGFGLCRRRIGVCRRLWWQGGVAPTATGGQQRGKTGQGEKSAAHISRLLKVD
ncbi:hypothetical protein EBQ26_08065 [Allofranklinella schreckenbergeri]|uniref:Uncharacterized protein n=1 Tax=Allofranklinella schreckenbergeri TaxID=1076744 RepID=A0A3M6Q5B5_9BURK|nr:hypothetical protein EBQ26_08065 [Allofranklinella schreckenbergeri]